MISVTTDSTGTTAEITPPRPPGLVLVPDPQWSVEAHEIAGLASGLDRWRAAATACGGECQHIAALFGDGLVPLRGAQVAETGDPIGLVDVLDLLVVEAATTIDPCATTIRVTRREWADGQSEEITLAYGGGRTEAVLEIQQHTCREWDGWPAEIRYRRVYFRATVAVRLREGLEPMGDDHDAWWSSLRASYDARAAAAGLSSDRW